MNMVNRMPEKKRRKTPYNKRAAKQMAKLEQLQERYPFKQPLSYYLMGVAGNPEEQEQKAFHNCLLSEFSEILGGYELEGRDGIPGLICPALIVATADFYDKHGKKMANYRHMGYQPGTPDMMILVRRGECSGLIIEMKSQSGSVTPWQKKTLAFLRTQGFSCHVCKGYAEALDVWLELS